MASFHDRLPWCRSMFSCKLRRAESTSFKFPDMSICIFEIRFRSESSRERNLLRHSRFGRAAFSAFDPTSQVRLPELSVQLQIFVSLLQVVPHGISVFLAQPYPTPVCLRTCPCLCLNPSGFFFEPFAICLSCGLNFGCYPRTEKLGFSTHRSS